MRLFPVPQPRPPIQGPVPQQTAPIPAVNQPVFAYYDARLLRQGVQTQEIEGPVTQTSGATKLATFPIPPVSQPALAYYQGRLLRQGVQARDLEGPITQFYGATKLATFPIPPVSQPELSAYLLRERLRYMVGATPWVQPQATVVPQQYIFPVSLPEARQWSAAQQNRYLVGALPRFEGATVQATVPIPPVSQPDLRYSTPQTSRYQVQIAPQLSQAAAVPALPESPMVMQQLESRLILDAPRQTDGATIQPTYIFPVSQPELSAYLLLERLRYMVGATPLVQSQATVVPQQYIFPVSLPEARQWSAAQQNRYLVGALPRFEGATVQATVPIPPVSQPEPSYLTLQQTRYLVPAMPRFEGATVQGTNPVPPVSQPDPYAYWRPRYAIAQTPGTALPIPQIIVQQTAPIPPVTGPDASWWQALGRNRSLVDTFKRLESIAAQTNPIPSISEPELSWWRALQMTRSLVDPVKRTEGATRQPGYLFPVSQPELRGFTALQSLRFLVRPVPYLDTLNPPIIRVPRIYYLSAAERSWVLQAAIRIFVLQPTRTGGSPAMISDVKDPNSAEDFQFDWSRELGTDTIVSSAWACSGVTLGVQSNTTTTATARLSGGKSGQIATVTNTVVLASGQTKKRTLKLAIGLQ